MSRWRDPFIFAVIVILVLWVIDWWLGPGMIPDLP